MDLKESEHNCGFQAGSSMSPTSLETLPGEAYRFTGVSGGEQPQWLPPSGAGRREPASVSNQSALSSLERCSEPNPTPGG